MKWKTILLCVHAVAGVVNHLAPRAADPAPAPAPAAKKKSNDLPRLKTLKIKFEIANFNYYDLTKETCPEKVTKVVLKTKAKPEKKAKKNATEAEKPLPLMNPIGDVNIDVDSPHADTGDAKDAVKEIHENTESITKQVQEGLGDFGKVDSPKLPWMRKKKSGESFLQVPTCSFNDINVDDLGETTSTECTTIMDVLRDAISKTVRGIIRCLYLKSLEGPGPAPAPGALPPASLLPVLEAPAPAPASFLQVKLQGPGSKKEAPAPAPEEPGPAPGPAGTPFPDVKMFITFLPGRPLGVGRSTIVEITFLDRPANGLEDVKMVEPILKWTMKDKTFKKYIAKALDIVTGVKGKIRKVGMKETKIEQWNIGKCEKHIRSIVEQFSRHYTRRQVPVALYNECTNFMTKMSFSHDHVLDPMDTKRCRRATKKFAEHWKSGQNAEESDFEQMCFHACEAKYGRNAPTCNIHAGDDLHDAPML